MNGIGKTLMIFGLLIAAVGALLWSGIGKGWLGRLPGDIHYSKGNFSFDFIIRDQIYFGVESPRERSERLHLFEVIVHSFDQNVFEGNHASFFLLVILTGRRQFTEGIFTVDRHDFVAGFIRSAVKRNRE